MSQKVLPEGAHAAAAGVTEEASTGGIDPLAEVVGARATDENSRRFKGLPRAPQGVHALGGDEMAWVWWVAPASPDEDDRQRDASFLEPPDIIYYIVKRYRRHPLDTLKWDYKGSTHVGLCPQAKVESLQNGQFYSFSVVAVSARGLGLESSLSEAVKVDTPLPKGWSEHWDPQSKRAFYQSLSSQYVTWERPQPLITSLDMNTYLMFTREEHRTLQRYYEKVSEYGRNQVSVNHVISFLAEAGISSTVMGKSEVMELCKPIANDKTPLTYSLFIQVLVLIKEALLLRAVSCKGCAVARKPLVKEKLEKGPGYKPLGTWVRYQHPGGDHRLFYHNASEGETSWAVPPDIKYYLPPSVEKKTLSMYSITEVKGLEEQFAIMDLDEDGAIGEEELALFLQNLGEPFEQKKVEKMLMEYTGKEWRQGMSFQEFCLLHCALKGNGRVSSAWKNLMSKLAGKMALGADGWVWPRLEEEEVHGSKICFCGCKARQQVAAAATKK